MLALLFSLILTTHATQIDPAIVNTFKVLQWGQPPTLVGAQFESARALVADQLKDLGASIEKQKFTNENCGRYMQVTHDLGQQILQSLLAIRSVDARSNSDDLQTLHQVRLYLLIPSYFGLHALFESRREAGFGILDVNHGAACAFSDREAFEGRFTKVVRSLSMFLREGIGNPGLLGFDGLTDRLLIRARAEEDHADQLWWGVVGGSVVASILFWEFAPPLALASARVVFGVVPNVLQTPAFVFGLRTVTLAGEGFAYQLADSSIQPDQSSFKPNQLGTWDEQLSSVQELLDTEIDAPAKYAIAVNMIKAQMALLYEPWLKANAAAFSQDSLVHP